MGKKKKPQQPAGLSTKKLAIAKLATTAEAYRKAMQGVQVKGEYIVATNGRWAVFVPYESNPDEPQQAETCIPGDALESVLKAAGNKDIPVAAHVEPDATWPIPATAITVRVQDGSGPCVSVRQSVADVDNTFPVVENVWPDFPTTSVHLGLPMLKALYDVARKTGAEGLELHIPSVDGHDCVSEPITFRTICPLDGTSHRYTAAFGVVMPLLGQGEINASAAERIVCERGKRGRKAQTTP